MEFNQINRQRGHFGNHDAAQRIGHGRVRVAQLKLDFVLRHGHDLDLGESLIRHDAIGYECYGRWKQGNSCTDGSDKKRKDEREK